MVRLTARGCGIKLFVLLAFSNKEVAVNKIEFCPLVDTPAGGGAGKELEGFEL